MLITDNVYRSNPVKKLLPVSKNSGESAIVPMDLTRQQGWYDFSVTIIGVDSFEKRYAGRVETGEAGYSDPFMGRIV